MKLNGQVPTHRESLNAQLIGGQQPGLPRRVALVTVELQPRARRDEPGLERVDAGPPDLLAGGLRYPAAERGGERLRAKEVAETRPPRLVRPPQPGQFLGDP